MGKRVNGVNILYTELSIQMIKQDVAQLSFSHIFPLPKQRKEVQISHLQFPQCL